MGVERSTMISSVIDRNVAEKLPDTTNKFPLQEIEGNQEDTINGWEIIYLMHRNSLSRLKKADKKGFFRRTFWKVFQASIQERMLAKHKINYRQFPQMNSSSYRTVFLHIEH